MRLIVAITGASGSVLAVKLLESLANHEVHVLVSDAAAQVLLHELGTTDLTASYRYGENDWDSPLASSSFVTDGMVIMPCSMKTLAMVAHGWSANLIGRAAENTLRTGRKLILVPRETPLSLAAIENMRLAKLAGAVLLPPNMAYYFHPKTLDDMNAFIAGKVLDILDIPHTLYRRWGSTVPGEEEAT